MKKPKNTGTLIHPLHTRNPYRLTVEQAWVLFYAYKAKGHHPFIHVTQEPRCRWVTV